MYCGEEHLLLTAHDTKLSRPIILRMYNNKSDRDDASTMLQDLKSPYVVSLLDEVDLVGSEQEAQFQPFLYGLVLERGVEGLGDSPPAPSQQLFYGRSMLRCIEFLHTRGLVHADLNPQCFVKFLDSDCNLSVRLANLDGVRHHMEPLPAGRGRLEFSAPELVTSILQQQSHSDPSALPKAEFALDIWSTALILYELFFFGGSLYPRVLEINPDREPQRYEETLRALLSSSENSPFPQWERLRLPPSLQAPPLVAEMIEAGLIRSPDGRATAIQLQQMSLWAVFGRKEAAMFDERADFERPEGGGLPMRAKTSTPLQMMPAKSPTPPPPPAPAVKSPRKSNSKGSEGKGSSSSAPKADAGGGKKGAAASGKAASSKASASTSSAAAAPATASAKSSAGKSGGKAAPPAGKAAPKKK